MPKSKPVITHVEILCLAIQAVSRKLHEYDQMVDECDTAAAAAVAKELRDQNAAIYSPKLEALKEMYRIETGTNFN